MLTELLERRPGIGLLASLTGVGTSILAWMQMASVVLGFAGACFGLFAGYYTWRIKKLHWERVQSTNHQQ